MTPVKKLRRPVFWDGGSSYRVRFASPVADGKWHWRLDSNGKGNNSVDLRPSSGTLISSRAEGWHAHPALNHGLFRTAPGNRTFCCADGTPAFFVIDTAWAMPWRAELGDVAHYAADRQAKGFNAVLLMTVQPDLNTRGPEGRNVDEGFEVGFRDLPSGHVTEINTDYFQYFDQIIDVLVEHGITPVLQPLFHGFGWKGQPVAGPAVPTAEYARYCRYLVARYGARPAIYLPGADGSGTEPQIEAGGREIHVLGRLRATHRHPLPAARPQPTPTRALTGSTSSRVRPGTWATMSPIGWRRCGAAQPAKGGHERRTDLRTLRPARNRRGAGGRAMRPGATCAPDPPWASVTVRPASGSGGCTRTNRDTNRTSSPGTLGGARLLATREAATSDW